MLLSIATKRTIIFTLIHLCDIEKRNCKEIPIQAKCNGYIPEENKRILPNLATINYQQLHRGWDFRNPSPIHAGLPAGLILCKSCVCLPEFLCAAVLSSLAHTFSLESSTPPGCDSLPAPSSVMGLVSWRKGI